MSVEARGEPGGYLGTDVRYGSRTLLRLDAGHADVEIVFSEVTKRRSHEDTKEEVACRDKGRHVWGPKRDYVGDGRISLHMTDLEGSKTGRSSWTNGPRISVDYHLSATQAAIAGNQRVSHVARGSAASM